MVKEVNSDYLLWRRIKTGESKAFDELYNQYVDVLFAFGQVYSKDREAIKDCIHDLFFELYKYRKNLSDTDNIKRYLFLSFKRKILSAKSTKLQLIYSDNIRETEKKSKLPFSDFTGENEDIERIKNEIEKLPDRQKEALILRFQSELSYTDIAEMMNISIESVRKNIYRSVKTLRTNLSIENGKKIIVLALINQLSFSSK